MALKHEPELSHRCIDSGRPAIQAFALKNLATNVAGLLTVSNVNGARPYLEWK